MYPRNSDQELTPVPNILAIGLAVIFATLIAVTAIAVVLGARDSNNTQATAVEELSK